MKEPLDQSNFAKSLHLRRMVWLGTVTGVLWGAALGSLYGFPFFYYSYSGISGAISALAIGAYIGAVYGLVFGSLHGLFLGYVTLVYFDPLEDERVYRRAMAATSLLLNTGIGLLLAICYLTITDDVDSPFPLIYFGVPLLIAMIACIIGSQRCVHWYRSGRFSRQRISTGDVVFYDRSPVMSKSFDQHNLAEPSLIVRMIWLGISAGVRWGAALGIVYLLILGLVTGDIGPAILLTLVAAGFGAVYGLVLGSLHGLMLGLVTTFFFSPLGDERIYRGALAATSMLVNVGVGCFLVIYFGGFSSVWSELRVVFVWPFPIATLASLTGSQLFAQWYIDERFRLAAKSVGEQTDESVLS